MAVVVALMVAVDVAAPPVAVLLLLPLLPLLGLVVLVVVPAAAVLVVLLLLATAWPSLLLVKPGLFGLPRAATAPGILVKVEIFVRIIVLPAA